MLCWIYDGCEDGMGEGIELRNGVLRRLPIDSLNYEFIDLPDPRMKRTTFL